jgi:hypothetical protein
VHKWLWIDSTLDGKDSFSFPLLQARLHEQATKLAKNHLNAGVFLFCE